MKRNYIHLPYLFGITILFATADQIDTNDCERCVKIEECPSVALLNKHEQQVWLEKVPCEGQQTNGGTAGFGMSTISERTYVCCPKSNIWKNYNGASMLNSTTTKRINKRSPKQLSNSQIQNNLRNCNPRESENTFYKTKYDQCSAQKRLLPDPDALCCGRDIPDNELTGGQETEIDPFPWSVYLRAKFKDGNTIEVFSCGGSIISRRYVLTAAHCVHRPEEKLIDVTITIADYNKDCKFKSGVPDCIKVLKNEEVIFHPRFHNEVLQFDIALVRLQDYMSTRYITPVCLPNFNVDHMHLSDLPLVTAVWNVDRHDNYVKQSTLVHLESFHKCHKFYPYLTKSHICAASRTGEATRKGDSGGPLMMYVKGNYYIIGIVSGKVGYTATEEAIPSLYTNVYRDMLWIKKNVRV